MYSNAENDPSIGLIFDDSVHYLDHLAPLCALLQIPLVVCESHIADLARRYYPGLKIVEANLKQLTPPQQIISCYPRPLLQASLFNTLRETIWIPHGHSDKPPCFEALRSDTAALVYGRQMAEWVRAANPDLPIHEIGNFRRYYFEQQKEFYRSFLTRKGTCFLYAPTWDDYEKSNSFWTAFPILAQTLPASCTLLVKLHPNTERQFPEKIEALRGRYEKKNIVWIENFPPVYPLLSISDAYIGDLSSVGYDFLTYNRPLFFLQKKETELSRAALHVKPEKVFAAYQQPDVYSAARKALYEKTYSAFTGGRMKTVWRSLRCTAVGRASIS